MIAMASAVLPSVANAGTPEDARSTAARIMPPTGPASAPLQAFDPPIRFSMARPPAFTTISYERQRDVPRLGGGRRVHDPLQFAGVRALRFDRGRYRPSPFDAKLELKLSGDLSGVDSHLGVAGGVGRVVQKALR